MRKKTKLPTPYATRPFSLTPTEKAICEALSVKGARIERSDRTSLVRWTYYKANGLDRPSMQFLKEDQVARLYRKGAIEPLIGEHGTLYFVLANKDAMASGGKE